MGTNETPGVTVNGGTQLPDDKQALAAAVQQLLVAEHGCSAAIHGLIAVAEVEAGADLIGAAYEALGASGQLVEAIRKIRQAYRSEVGS